MSGSLNPEVQANIDEPRLRLHHLEPYPPLGRLLCLVQASFLLGGVCRRTQPAEGSVTNESKNGRTCPDNKLQTREGDS